MKYTATFVDLFHVGALYKFNGSNGAGNTAFQAQLGAEFAGASIDGYYSKVKSAISSAPLTPAQVTALPPAVFGVELPLRDHLGQYRLRAHGPV